jgi:CSLREA domain-containing protein
MDTLMTKKPRALNYGVCLFLVMALLTTLLPLSVEGKGAPAAPNATLTVNSEGDEGDAYFPDGICDTTGNPNTDPPTPYSGICTLRAALQTADNTSGAETITFSGPLTIQPATSLSAIWNNDPVTINGGGVVTIDGSLISDSQAGLALYGGGNHTISGLIVKNFSKWGILVADGVGGSTISDNEVRGNGHGIHLASLTPNNTVSGNLVVENSTGIYIASDGNTLTGNKIGTDGTQDLGNSGDGIKISLGSNNQIGDNTGIFLNGSCTGSCNLISGNGGDGIDIGQGTDPTTGVSNVVQGNFIGTNQAGTAAIPNDDSGIETNGGSNRFVGNLVSGNDGHGIEFSAGANGNIVRGNFIGTDVNGTAVLGNAGGGINMEYANGNVIGGAPDTPLPGSCTGDCNLISANGAGITITQAIKDGNNSVIGNFIGTDLNGTAALGNHGHGVWLQGLDNTVASNLISANGGNGVHVYGIYYGGSVNTTTVRSNLIGTAIDGETSLGNSGYGVVVENSSGNFVGGDEAGQGNTIAFNAQAGVAILDTAGILRGVDNRILGNAIFDNDGSRGLGIDLGDDGVSINDSDDGDDGPNHLQNFPVITSVHGVQVSGVLTSTPNATFRLEFFANPECSNSDYGQGKTFLGSLDVTTHGSGVGAFSGALSTAPTGQLVSATATDPDGNTSEFSACFGGLVVNSTGDAADSAWGDDLCDTGGTTINGDPECTLRAALQEANVQNGLNTISFDIPDAVGVPDIFLSGPLPRVMVDEPVVIDGTTQPGGWVTLFGYSAGDDVNGLELGADGSRVSGLIICGFDGHGLLVDGNDNNVTGNLIGIDSDNLPCGNGGNGIRITAMSEGNTIGGVTTAARNVIANNEFSGIYVLEGSSGNLIQGNYIGANLAGDAAQGNQLAGVHVSGHGNTVGGTVGVAADSCSGACNLISGNRYGVLLSGSQATSNTVLGNFIGTDQSGASALGNAEVGVVATDGASDNLIGGDLEAARNLISGNGPSGGHAVQQATLYGGVAINGSESSGNTVLGNYVGVAASGVQVLPNRGNGVWLYQSPDTDLSSNLISGNDDDGVGVVGSAATRNTLQDNLIGTESSGTAALPNDGDGVFIDGAPDNTVGGSGHGQGNVISGNGGSGLKISGNGANNNTALGNLIGVKADLAGVLPNGGDGVLIGAGATGNQIGGADEGAENVIGGNSSHGVEVNGAGAAHNVLQGNYIGTLSDGVTRLGNGGHGVYFDGGASHNTVGGVITTANTIAFNGGDGVYAAMGGGNTVRRNSIYENVGLGIDLGTHGVTPNDSGDGDSGANNLQNFPVLTSLVVEGGAATVDGTLESVAGMTYTLDFFTNDACDPSLHGQGQRFLGTITTTTGANGEATFTFTSPLSSTENIVATATDVDDNTSEFSKCARHTERAAVDPAMGATWVFTNTRGNRTIIQIPAGAITYTEPVTMAYASIEEVSASGFTFAGNAFELSAYLGNTPLLGLNFSPPITVTIHYGDADVVGLDEEALMLLYWDGTGWSDGGGNVVERNPAGNYAVFTLSHLSDFALLTSAKITLYLPLVSKGVPGFK